MIRKIIAIFLTIVLTIFIFVCINDTIQKQRLENVYGVTTVGEANNVDMSDVIYYSKYPMAMVDSEETGIVIYLNDKYYEYLNLDKNITYSNNILDENYVYIPANTDVTVEYITENNSESKSFSATYINTLGDENTEMINKYKDDTGVELALHPAYYNTNSYFLILLVIILTLLLCVASMREFEKNKNKNLLYKLGGIKNKELQKIVRKELKNTWVLCNIIVLIICLLLIFIAHSFVIALITFCITFVILLLLYFFGVSILIKKFEKFPIQELIKGKKIFESSAATYKMTINVVKILLVAFTLITSIALVILFSQISSAKYWMEVEDYSYMNSVGIYCDGNDAIQCDAEHRYEFVKDVEESNNAIYSYAPTGSIPNLIVTNYNMMELQYEEAEKLDPSKNYLIVPSSVSVDKITDEIYTYYTNASKEYDFGNMLDYEVIEANIDPMYSYNLTEGYYPKNTVYYVAGSDNTAVFSYLHAYQNLYIQDAEGVDYTQYPYVDPSAITFTDMKGSVLALYLLLFIVIIILILLLISIYLLYYSTMKNIITFKFKENRIKNTIRRLSGFEIENVYAQEFKKQSRNNKIIFGILIPILILIVKYNVVLSILLAIVFILLLFVVDPKILNKAIIEVENDLLIEVIKGKDE